MANNTLTTLAGIFKKIYHNKVVELIPGECPLQDMIKLDTKNKIGASFNVSLQLRDETGWTFLGTSGDVASLNGASASKVLQAEVKASAILLRSGLTYEAISRSKSGDKAAVQEATKTVVESNLKSHKKLVEFTMMYGQSEKRICESAYSFTGNVNETESVTDGSGTVNGIVFTNAVNTVSNHILLNPKQISPSFLISLEGAVIQQVSSSDTVLASGNIVSVDIDNGIIEVDFTPDGSAAASFISQAGFASKSMVGLEKILKNQSSTIFGIDASEVSLFRGNSFDHADADLTFADIIKYVSKLANYGLSGDVVAMVSNRTFSSLIADEAALRRYDGSYSSEKGKKGSRSLEFYCQTGVIKIVPSNFVRQGDAFILEMDSVQLIGSQEIGLGVPGSDSGLFNESETQNVVLFSSWSDQQILLHKPRRSALITNIKVY